MPSRQPEEAQGFKLLGHDRSAAWGGGSIVEVHKGYAYVGAVGGASYNGPEGFTAHDVRDPRNPNKVYEFRAPPGVHCHKVRVVGDHHLYVNSERLVGDKGKNARAGLFIFDISKPDQPREVGFYDTPGSGPHRFGVDNKKKLAFLPNDAPMIRGDRMYCAWWGGGISIIDCTDLREMKLVGHLQWSPPFPGSNHTCWPIGDKPYLVVTDEARARQKYWDSQFMWIVDIRKETNPIPVATFFPDRDKYFHRPGRFGAHNILENITTEGPWANIVFLTYFNAGLRAVDVSDVLRPKEIGCYVPELPDGQDAIQSNDIGADEHGRIYLIDRAGAGMHILEYTG